MLNNRAIFIVILIFIFSPLTLRAVSTQKSLEWQKVSLEEKIYRKLDSTLKAILPSGQYILDVLITTKSPSKPDFTIAGSSKPKKVKFTNKTISKDSPKDYIVFSKLGLEAPLLSDMTKVEPEKKSDYEYLWRYNQSLNIFKNIEDISIQIYLSEKLIKKTRTSVEDVVKKTNFNLGDVAPVIQFSYINMKEEVEKELVDFKSEKKPDILEWLGKFANTIGLILATLLFGIISYLLLRKYEKMLEKEKENSETPPPAAAIPEKEDSENDKDDNKDINLGGGESDESDSKYSGIERFKNYMLKSAEEASLIIKKWIKGSSTNEKLALKAIVDQLENNHLLSLFDYLSVKQRETWKDIISDESIKLQDLAVVNEFISSQIIEDIIVPSLNIDNETIEILLDITEKSAASFINENDKLGAMLISIMNTKYISKIMDFLDNDKIEAVMNSSYHLSEEEISSMLPNFKERIKEYTSTEDDNKMINKIMDLILLAPPTKELSLYSTLFTNENFNKAKEAATQNFPSHLMLKLSKETLSLILESYPMKNKTELVSSFKDNEEKQLIITEAFAPEGSTMRDMLDLELEKYTDDLTLNRYVLENSDNIWSEFVTHSRKILRGNEELKDQLTSAIESWIDSEENPNITPIGSASGQDNEGDDNSDIPQAA